MKERPILFSGPMVRAILEGRKTQTRRIVKLHHELSGSMTGRAFSYLSCDGGYVIDNGAGMFQDKIICPYGQPGERLWVKETWAAAPTRNNIKPTDLYEGEHIQFRASYSNYSHYVWRPSIFMRRWMARILLEIASVRVEKLQEISREDAKAEGLTTVSKDWGSTLKWGIPDKDGMPGTDDFGWNWKYWSRDPIEAYRRLWDNINGRPKLPSNPRKRRYARVKKTLQKIDSSWNANPWVWVITFERIK